MEESERKIKYARITVYAFFAIIIASIVIYTLNEIRIKKMVLNNYKTTIAYVEDVGVVGIESNVFLTYSYIVNNVKYERTIQAPYEFEDCCEPKTNKCCTAKYWVIYSINKPDKSLINLTIDLQGIKNPIFPESLDYFN